VDKLPKIVYHKANVLRTDLPSIKIFLSRHRSG
jgi:hypothetical protein